VEAQDLRSRSSAAPLTVQVAALVAALLILVGMIASGCSLRTTVTRPTTPTTVAPVVTSITEAGPGYTDVTAEQARELIDTTRDLVILDVSSMYSEGHLPGAVNYYLGDGTLEAALPSLDKTVPYLVYCQGEAGSIPGVELLVKSGFTTVYRLAGDYPGWADAGYPTEK
jgi:rhodanese-related sulfurtransferase